MNITFRFPTRAESFLLSLETASYLASLFTYHTVCSCLVTKQQWALIALCIIPDMASQYPLDRKDGKERENRKDFIMWNIQHFVNCTNYRLWLSN